MNNDLISRDALKKCARVVFDKDLGRLRVVDVSDIDNAPTVEPRIEYGTDGQPYKLFMTNGNEYKRPQGEWIEENSETGALGIKYTWFRCNQCGWENSLVIPRNFCPNCGADMRGKNND